MCRKLNVSRSGYYEWCKRNESNHAKQDRYLKEKIRTIYEQNKKRYGSPRIHGQLREQGIRCGKKRVEGLMREMGIQAQHKRKFKVTTNSKHDYQVAPYLLNRKFHIHHLPERIVSIADPEARPIEKIEVEKFLTNFSKESTWKF